MKIMRIATSIAFVCCSLIVFAPSTENKPCRTFWRPCVKPTLPSPSENPQFYEKLQVVPPKKETAKKLITNFLGIHFGPRGKRSVTFEDTVFVLDGSGSVAECEFNKGKKALKSLIEIDQSGYDAKYAAVTFSDSATVNFEFLSRISAAARMDGIPYPDGNTNTQDGLEKARELFANRNSGARRISRKMVFLVTDGRSNVDNHKTIPNAETLKKLGIEIFVVAVGDYIYGIDEMANVASRPIENYLYRVETSQGFYEVVKLVIKEIDPGKYKIIQGQYDPPC